MSEAKPLITAAGLMAADKEYLVLVDASSGADSYASYGKGHLAGAIFLDADNRLSSKTDDPSKGGRHPLPDPEVFSRTLGELGIRTNSHVVIYDHKQGANMAARFWWMLRAAGHEKVQVLDGGMEAAVRAGYPVETGERKPEHANPYPVKDWSLPRFTIEEVDRLRFNKDYLVVDVRDAYRYRGESEPIDTVAGHIPGAVNIPFASNLGEDGTFLPANVLQKKYSEALEGRPVDHLIVHCGSGVTACHTLLALEQAGLPGAGLYVGSWSEWSRTGREIGKGSPMGLAQ